ncbi:aminoglycoside phosphotransferase (APT) family kinase protein [Bradyrhizobium sp. USDA 4524]|uniref:phosphotransferase family protein n=1 Tax=unclassified Bradyrhizobium TaxID=2631580 RepID=UPI00209DCFC7|nr:MULTISPECIES: phosphotransferase family protein [unclassified Bradyrhizobium]MCP1845960.1 aminoglycoside phosphotransferase (APT) family kinase protein [Bradyrhizobium sp. USDA 4538]MCP1907406.1 aminoglycoside phosphotransferase (APT) family kinase protein [Bradyrhizobium sp. USDA 4537]MCP1985192.1 aminoglycoside phosphotransferase (APT) family kinase protein [Bradyrhizobium sp. USDA 4539]
MIDQRQKALQVALAASARAGGQGEGRIEALRQLGGGASKESWSFDFVTAERSVPMVLRVAPLSERFSGNGVLPIATEAALIREAYRDGLSVPEFFFELTPDAEVGEGYAMARLTGESVGPRILKSQTLHGARAGLARQCGMALAQLHALSRDHLPALPTAHPAVASQVLEDRFRATGQSRPVFELAFGWLSRNRPEPRPLALVHGDFRNGNLMVGPNGLVGILDWEQAHIGDPIEDLGWLCVESWRFQNPSQPVGGFGGYQDLIDGYAEAGGRAPSLGEIRYWEIYGSLRGA